MIDHEKLQQQLEAYRQDFDKYHTTLEPKISDYYKENIKRWDMLLKLRPSFNQSDTQGEWNEHNLRYPHSLEGTHGEFIIACIVSQWNNTFVRVGLTKDEELSGKDLFLRKDTWKDWYSIQVKLVTSPTTDTPINVHTRWFGKENKLFGFRYSDVSRLALVDVVHKTAYIGDFIEILRYAEQLETITFSDLEQNIDKGAVYHLV